MPETKTEKLNKILEELKKVGGIEGSMVVSRDGLKIASDVGNIDADTFAAMSAAMQGAAETAASELKKGEVEQIIIETDTGRIISVGAGKKSILVIMAGKKVNLGLALIEMGRSAEKIAGILK
jgi:hypothetical protein